MTASRSARRAAAVLALAALAGCGSLLGGDPTQRPPSSITGGVRNYGAEVPTVTTVVLGSAPGDSRIITPLDGRAYAITLVAPDGTERPDELVFDTAMLASVLCRDAGYVRVGYETSAVPGGIAFKARCESVATGRSEFAGVARDEDVEGTVVRSFFDGRATYTLQFAGRRVR